MDTPVLNIKFFQKHLQLHGWNIANGSAIATKDFQTAVGTKTAFAYFYFFKLDPSNYRLSANYQSQGRNILSTSSQFIPVNSSEVEVESLIAKFSDEVNAIVSESYAYKLNH